MGGVSIGAQITGSLAAVIMALSVGTLVYLGLKYTVGIRLSKDDELLGADLSVHHISAYPERDVRE